MTRLSLQDVISLAMQMHQAGRLAEAESLFAQILRAQPGWGEGHALLANVLAAAGKSDQAVAALRNAIANKIPNPAICHSNMSVLFYRAGKFEDAAAACRQAIALQPENPLPHRNLGDALLQLEQYELAERSFCTALQLDPKMADVHNGIGLTLYHRGRIAEALEEFQTVLKSDPANVNACMNSVLCQVKLGDRETAEATLRRTTVALAPDAADLTSGLVMILNYTHGDDPSYMLRESLEFNRRHIAPVLARTAAPVIPTPPLNGVPNRPLRIGYVSPDFKHHSVSFFLEPLLANHDRKRFTIACYAEVEKPDAKTAEFQRMADLWRSTVGRSDDEVAGQIRADQIDILIDLAGHTVGNRLPVFARRPAPIQITWLGYPNTTGISTMDYRLTDGLADPSGVDSYYTEKLIRLPDAFFSYQPPPLAPAVSPLPMLAEGHVTFGSFNNISKVTPAICRLWSSILRAVPDSKLLIAGVAYSAGDRLRVMFDGIAPERIELADSMAIDDYLKLFSRVDIGLDSYPWAGHTTTCHALWMGVPVVSLAGPTAVSRAGMSVMGNLSMQQQWVAATADDYVRLAIEWASRPVELAHLRTHLRDRLRQSRLMDAVGFSRQFERQLRELWAATLAATAHALSQ